MPDTLSQQSYQDQNSVPDLNQSSATQPDTSQINSIYSQPAASMPAYGSSPEMMPITESAPIIETTAERKEDLPKPEVPIPAALKEDSNQTTNTLPINSITTNEAPKVVVPKVVSKKPPLHHIEHPVNDLTKKADEEEEDFIKHVEEIHTIA